MSSFLQTRRKEFGLLVMHGMTNMQLRKMVFLENVLIGFFATISGISLGLIFSKMLLLLAENILDLQEILHFYFPLKAIGLTFVAFLLLFILISFATVVILKGNKLVDLIKGSAAPKKEPRASLLLSILAFLLLAIGYFVALIVKGLTVAVAMIPVTIIVIIGTYFLFTQLSVYIIKALRKRQSIFWKKTNLVLFSDLAYRMKDNARTFFFVAIVSTVAFTAIGSLVGFRSMLFTSMLNESPFAFEYISEEGDRKESERLSLIHGELDESDIPFTETTVIVKNQPVKGEAGIRHIVSETDYNNLGESSGRPFEKLTLTGDEAVLVYYENTLGATPNYESELLNEYKSKRTVELAEQNTVLKLREPFGTNLFPRHSDFVIVSDEMFAKLTEHESEEHYSLFYIKDWKETVELSKRLAEQIPEWGENHTFFALPYTWNGLNQAYGAVLFIGLFIGAVFFVAAGSFLYFRLYTDLNDEKKKFAMIAKLGLTNKELSKIMTVQLAILFFIPIVVAVIHGAIALTALQNMFNYSLVKESILVLGSFTLIQIVYFLFIRMGYIRKIKQAL